MKKINFIVLLFACYSIQAQLQSPWMENLQKSKAASGITNPVKYQEIISSFENYWKNRDHKAKGSGYKPGMRWMQFHQNSIQPDGTLPTKDFIWNQWSIKKKMAIANNNKAAFNWTPMGPFDHNPGNSWSPGQGRVNVIAIDPNNDNTIYIGAPAGGIWKSINKGATWTPLIDDLPQIGVSGIAIDPKNSNIIYISTGDDDSSDSYSIGVLKSTDGGTTWAKTGLEFTNSSTTSNDIYIDPNNSNILWIATSVGVYKTTNAGVSWTKTLNGNIKDIKLKPGDSNIVYAVTSTAFYKSTNAGNSFSRVQSGLPSSSGRLVIDVTPANPQYVYVLSARTNYAFQGVYRSTNSGDSFTKTAETSDIFESTQAWYDLALGVSDQDANTVFVGCINVWRSTDGGNNFTKINNWSSPNQASYTHADIHFLRYHKGRLLCGSDGGVYISDNNGASFTDHTKGLQIGQFYRISVAKNASSTNLVGGLQDNGGYGLKDSTWYNYHGADGMDCAVSGNNPNTYYGFIQNGAQLYVTTNRGANQSFVARGPESGNWVTPLVSDTNGSLYAGYSSFYKLVNNSFVKQGNFNFGGKIDFIELDPTNENTIYVARDKNLYRSTNKGINWNQISNFQTNITSIEVHNDNSNIVYVTTRGSSNGGVFKSTNQGGSFTNISGNLPSEGKFIVRHEKGSESIYLGTYLGVYHKNGDNAWQDYSPGLPTVAVRDLEINYQDKVVIAGTYGRGIWKAPLAGTDTDEDTQAPSNPTGLTASNITQTALSLSWTASTDNVGVTRYDVYQGNNVIGTATSTSYNVTGLNANTAYQFRVRAKDAAGNISGFSNTASATTLDDNNTPTYCNSNGQNASDEYINNVLLGNINNTSTGVTGGYGDYTSLSTTLLKGASNTITITPAWTGTVYNEAYSVWIDYNQDGDFSDSGEQVWTKTASKDTSVSGNFIVPNTATNGTTRMRVSMKYNGIPTPCESFRFGEVEDYTVSIETGAEPTCTDGIQNGNETGIDCGGDCKPCTANPTCNDGIQNGNETGIDCGGSECEPCSNNGTVVYVDIDDKTINSSTTWLPFQIEVGDEKYFGPWYSGNTLRLVTYGKDVVCEGTSSNITLLEEGVQVGASNNFTATNNSFIISSSSYTNWNGKSGYIGFNFKINGATHYGWFYATVANDGSSYTILDYAYNTTAGESLTTSRNSGAAPETVKEFGKEISIHPNPFTNFINIDLSGIGDEAVTVRVYNLLGMEVYHKRYDKNPGMTSFGSRMNPGTYLIRIESKSSIKISTVIKSGK